MILAERAARIEAEALAARAQAAAVNAEADAANARADLSSTEFLLSDHASDVRNERGNYRRGLIQLPGPTIWRSPAGAVAGSTWTMTSATHGTSLLSVARTRPAIA